MGGHTYSGGWCGHAARVVLFARITHGVVVGSGGMLPRENF